MEAAALIRFLAGFVLVMGMLAGFGWLLRRYGHRISGLGLAGPRTSAPRLAIIEALPLDPRRRLLLIRRDDTEHLVLIGPDQQAVIETGIRRAAAPAPTEPPTALPPEPAC